MRVLVCGGRDFDDKRALYHVLDRIEIEHRVDCIITGGARGADGLALDWAYDDRHHPTVAREVYQADWNKHGRAAGPLRNQQMLERGQPDLVVAFPGGRGTADMVRRAKAAGVKVLEFSA